MAEIVRRGLPLPHKCYDELFTMTHHAWPKLTVGTVSECSCGRKYMLVNGGILAGLWNSLRGHGHVTDTNSIWDQWKEVPKD